jgi:hypothetical protein
MAGNKAALHRSLLHLFPDGLAKDSLVMAPAQISGRKEVCPVGPISLEFL